MKWKNKMSSAQVSSQHISRFLNHHGSSPDYHSDNNTSSSPQQSPQSLHSPQSNYTMSPPPNIHHPPHSGRYDNYQSVYMSRIPPLHQQQQHAIIPIPQFTHNSPPAPKKSFCIDALLAKNQENQENQAKNGGASITVPLVSEEEAVNRLRDDGREYNSPSPDDLSRLVWFSFYIFVVIVFYVRNVRNIHECRKYVYVIYVGRYFELDLT